MKSLKSLLTLAIAMSISSVSLADTNPLTLVKDSAKSMVTEQTTQLKEGVATQMNSATQAVNSTKDSAKSAVMEKVSNVKEEAVTKANSMKATTSEKVATAKESVTSQATMAKTAMKSAKKININKADVKTLQMLDGIGEAKAKAIVEYRKANGKIKNLTELSKVSGIGESTLEKVKSAISF